MPALARVRDAPAAEVARGAVGRAATISERGVGGRFIPILYFLRRCPHCFKLQLFLSEAGLLDRFEIREYVPGTAAERKIRAELAHHLEAVTFPAAQVAPGAFVKDCDALIAHYATEAAVDPAHMSILQAFIEGPLHVIHRLRAENIELTRRA